MNRESETYFSELPEVHVQRSKIEKPHGLKTTWTVGDIIPIYVDDILPGTTISMKMAAVMRMQTPLNPTMDNLYTDIMWFFCPYRLTWNHWRNMWGQNDQPWYPQVEYEVPQVVTTTSAKFEPKSLADYMGLPVGVAGLSVNALPFRAYCRIWNEWFRSTPLQQETPTTLNDTSHMTTSETFKGGNILKANKIHDYFTSALPSSQYGPEVTLPLGTLAPVITKFENHENSGYPINWQTSSENILPNGIYRYGITMTNSNTSSSAGIKTNTEEFSQALDYDLTPVNLYTDLTKASSATVSALRSALAIQHFYEAEARYGSRYTEFLRGIFGVVSPDARLSRTEYLGGKRIPHMVQTVVQTSSTDATSPQGNTGAYSHTADADEMFTKSFTEHGVLIGLLVTRYKHTYDQGIPQMFSRKKWTDYYIPQFNGISEVPVYNKEIYAQGTSADDEVFGYQEYGASYRYMPDQVTSEMRTTYSQSLDSWHYADHYTTKPVLGATWIQENRSNVDRTLAVSSGLADQLFGDFYFKPTYVLPMPIYSTPGLDKI